jgi:adenylate cyclase
VRGKVRRWAPLRLMLALFRTATAWLIGRRLASRLRSGRARLVAAGTAGYPPEVQRRLKILNVIAYLIALATVIYAVQQASMDFEKLKPAIALNVALVVLALLVPFAHRINDIAGGLLLVAAEGTALFGFSAFFGRDGGAPLHYIVLAAAPFVVFGLKRIWLVLSVVMLGLVLHLKAWFAYHDPMVVMDQAVVDAGYTQAAITTVGLIAASVYYAFSLAEKAKAETDALLRNILPDPIVERLKAKPGEAIADSHDSASVLFADISGFVALAQRLGAAEVVRLLNRIVMAFDALAERHGVEKIKTIGDAYMAVAGLPDPAPDHTRRLAAMALDMQEAIKQLNAETGLSLEVRIGIASGPVMAGVIGAKKFSYDVWGEAVNLAARLEQQAAPGRVLACPCCRQLLDGHFAFESRGLVEIKGMGPRETWYVLPKV